MSAEVAGPSRGGAPSGGRGRGRGRGGRGGAGSRLVNMGDISMSDILEVSATQGTGRHGGRVPYPTMEAQPVLSSTTRDELRIVESTLNFARMQRATPWWIRDGAEEEAAAILGAAGTDDSEGPGTAAAAAAAANVAATRAASKRGAADIIRYSDRKRLREAEGQARSAAENSAANKTALARVPRSLNDPEMAKSLYREAFPMDLWRMYMQGETKRLERREDAERRRRNRTWQDVMTRMEQDGAGAAAGAFEGNPDVSDAENSVDAEDDAIPDDYEDDEDDDYADNYFDNGEEDEAGDLGGGEAEAEFD